jgi:hypothetical protein
MENDLFLMCECHAESMQVTYEKEYNEYWFAYWGYGFNNKKSSLWHRIKNAYLLLKTGTLHKDFIILDKDKAQQLADYINKNNNDNTRTQG